MVLVVGAASDLHRVAGLTVAGGGSATCAVGISMSRRGHRRGDGLAMDFWFPISSASGRYLLLHRLGVEGSCDGAMAASPLGLATDRWWPWSVQGLWLVDGRSGAAPRRRRRGKLDLEVEGELGMRP